MLDLHIDTLHTTPFEACETAHCISLLQYFSPLPLSPLQHSHSRSMSVMAREELCTSQVNFNAYAELNVPNFGVDIEIPSDVDYYSVNQARRISKDVVSK